MLNCNPCSTDLSKRYDIGLCEPLLRPYGVDRMLAFECGLTFVDILDVDEWETNINAGKILLSPFFGKVEIGDPSTENLEDGLGRKVPDFSQSSWKFTTFSTLEDYTDEDWWYAFHKKFSNYTWAFIQYHGRLILNDTVVAKIKAELAKQVIGAVACSDPGLLFSLETIPTFKEVGGRGKSGQWESNGSFKHNHVLRSVEIPGLTAVLQAENVVE